MSLAPPSLSFGLRPAARGPVHQHSARNKEAILDIVYEIAERADAPSPQVLAEELCMIIDATYVSRVPTGDPGVISTARRMAERVIQSHLGRRAPERSSRRQSPR